MEQHSDIAENKRLALAEGTSESLYEIRVALIDRLILLLSWAAVPLSGFYLYRIITESLPAYFYPFTFLLICFIPLALLRGKCTLQQKFLFLILPLFFSIAITLNFQGLYSWGIMLMALAIALCSFFLDGWVSLVAFTGFILVLSIVAFAHTVGVYESPILLEYANLAMSRLGTSIVLIALFGILASLIIRAVTEKNAMYLRLQKEHREKIQELASALEEINALRSFVNVCSKCQKIKINEDDENAEEWVSMQSFIARTGNVQLNHGFCPTCFSEAMSELDTR